MEVRVGELRSVVRATDAGTLLPPAALEQVVETVLARLRTEQERECRIEDERRVRSSVAAEGTGRWRP
jgi:hypothetical protein